MIVAPKGAETIPPPAKDAKPMPKSGGGEPPQTQIQVINPLNPLQVQPNLEAPSAPPAIGPASLNLNPGRPF